MNTDKGGYLDPLTERVLGAVFDSGEKRPDWGSPYMIEKWLKAGTVWQCPNPECKHKQPAPEQPAEVVVMQ